MAFPEPFDDRQPHVERDAVPVRASALVPSSCTWTRPLTAGFSSGVAFALVAVALGHAALRGLGCAAAVPKNRNLTDARLPSLS